MTRHPMHKVIGFQFVEGFILRVRFDDGTEQAIDFEPVLKGEMYGPLSNPNVFKQVTLDDEAGTLVWPNGADFDPATLHDWPSHAREFAKMAERWESATADHS